MRGRGGVEHLMLMSDDRDAPSSIDPSLDDQIGDMRLLQNAGFWEIAKHSGTLALHSPSAAPRIERETGSLVHVLPFANYRAPTSNTITESDRIYARRELRLDDHPPGTIHLGSFGYVDTRTKLTDMLVEAAAWLTQWGHSVALHFVGSASPLQARELNARAQAGGLAGFQITGFVSEEQFRQWLLAVDLGVQLRISPMLGVSGPLSDLAAYGTPAVASRGLCVDVDPPTFIRPLQDAVSPVMVAEAIEDAIGHPLPPDERESLRVAYVERKSPDRYARALLGLLEAES
jgi:glycosyltransferase involved in cell wall biosynthesis